MNLKSANIEAMPRGGGVGGPSGGARGANDGDSDSEETAFLLGQSSDVDSPGPRKASDGQSRNSPEDMQSAATKVIPEREAEKVKRQCRAGLTQ